MPGDTSVKPTCEVGGVFGGVIGSKAEAAGEGESVLSSVRVSGASADEVAEELDTCAERRDPRPKAADR